MTRQQTSTTELITPLPRLALCYALILTLAPDHATLYLQLSYPYRAIYGYPSE